MVIDYNKMFNDNIIYEYPKADRVVVIGDIHGDLKRFKNILLDANIINKNIEWIAEPQNTVVVQLGDQIDSLNRNPNVKEWEVIDDTEVLNFTDFLDNIAKAKGGKVISLIGNHELMNTIGNFSYVSKKSLLTTDSRYEKFKPRGDLSYILSKRPIVTKIGDLLFCHAGLKQKHIEILEKTNKHISHINSIWRRFILTGKVELEDKEIFDTILLDSEGVLWTRTQDEVNTTKKLLNSLGCVYMFIGHNTVDNIHCLDNLIWFVDSGISRSYGLSSYQYIDIKNYQIDVRQLQDNL